MNKLLKTLSMALLCIALSLCASCKKDNNSSTGGGTQTIATVTTNDITEITSVSAVCGGEVTSENGWAVTQRGVCWSTNPNPTLSDSYTIDGEGIGQFTSTLSGLLYNTTYYVRAYAKNAVGTSFGQEKSFTTLSWGATVTTNDVTEITIDGALCGGEVTSENGWVVTQRGVCWSTNPNPTLSDSYTIDGDGIGKFTSTLTALSTETNYHVRAYAKYAADTIFGQEKSFTTLSWGVTVTTDDVSEISYCSALCGGEVTSENGWAVTQRGVCWSASQNPTINDSHTSDGTGTGTFTSSLTNINPGTIYYVRAYATTRDATTYYGNEVSFTTDHFLTFTVSGVTFKMLPVEGGTFYMGAQNADPNGQNYALEAYDIESPIHHVTLSDFYMGETEVTQALWIAVMGNNPSCFTGNNQRPVEMVSWDDCQTFLSELNSLLSSQLNGKQFCLPTEAEWEYAARGGNQSQGYKYSGSSTIDDVAWYNGSNSTHPVAQKQANELGLYDMNGNVWEWCHDWYGDYSSSAQANPTGPSSGSYRVCRGGCWRSFAAFCRVSNRAWRSSDTYEFHGLRLALR